MEQIPSWLDKDFLTNVLQGGEDKEPKVTVVNFTVKPAIPAGENFSSYLFRVLVHYRVGSATQEESKSLIVKLPVKEGLIFEIAGQSQFYDKEEVYYGELLEKMIDKIKWQFTAKSYRSPVKGVIVLEDLKPDYFVADRRKNLDLAHSKLVFTSLAKFHAAAVAVHHENPKLIELVGGECFYIPGSPLQRWIEYGCKAVGENLSELEGCKEYADFFLSRADNIWNLAVEGVKPKPGRFNVLLHGDVWVNNVMFKYNEKNEPIDVKLLDFQISRYSTPVFDLLYFLYSSANDEVRENHQIELFELYLKTLNEGLELVGCAERLTMEELKVDIKTAAPWFITTIVFCVGPITIHGTEEGGNYEEITSENIAAGKCDPMLNTMFSFKPFKELVPILARQYFKMLKSL
uniref:CHK kinase-like domain-containing protein n=1 Tax=Graphocephala atropunctata TaxID=36148 RepID=A0A1B6L7Z9_9HEMI